MQCLYMRARGRALKERERKKERRKKHEKKNEMKKKCLKPLRAPVVRFLMPWISIVEAVRGRGGGGRFHQPSSRNFNT
jgi:hypothetical protein